MSAEKCRETARRIFRAAVAEDDPKLREKLLVQAESWMLRARIWTPICGYRFDEGHDGPR